MKKLRLTGLIMSVLLLALPGCGGGKTDKAAKTSKTAVESGKPLKIWVYDEGRIDVLTGIGQQFEEKYGIKVEVSLVELGQIRNQFLLASGGEEVADMAIIPHDNLGALVENGAVVTVDLGAKAEKFLQPAIDGFMYNGELYGLPLAVENIGFFRNTDMVPEAPETWEEMISTGKELVKSGKAEVIMGFPDATYNVFPVYTSYGGFIFGKNSDGSLDADKMTIAGEGMVKGLTLLTDMVDEGLAPETIDWDGAHVLFEQGKAPFIMTGPWALNRFKEAGVRYAISRFPAVSAGGEPGAPFLGIQGVVISSSSSQPILARSFLVDFVASQENMQKIYDAEPRPSAWLSIFESASDGDAGGFNEAGLKAVPMPSIPAMGYVWDAWVNAAALAFSGELTPQEALENAKNQIETQIAEGK